MRIVIHSDDLEEAARASEAVSRLLPGSTVEIIAANPRPDHTEALQESEERSREIFEHGNDIIFTLDFTGRVTSINGAGERLLGYTREELVGTNIWPIVPPHTRGLAQRRLAEKSGGGASTSYDGEVISKDGCALLLEMSSHTLVRAGRPAEVLVIARDVTQRRQAEEALRESEERFRELFEQANDAVCLTTIEGDFIAVNSAAERTFGRPRDELLKMNTRQIIAADHLDLANQMRDSKVAGGGRTLYELDIVRPDGTRVPLEVNSTVVRRDGRVVAIQAVARDIRERRKADQALRESEERFRRLFDSATDVVYTIDLNGYYTSVNDAAARLIGLPREEIIGANVSKFVVAEDLPVTTHMRDRKLGGAGQTLYELNVVTADGRKVTLELNTTLIYQDGQPVGIQGIGRDVTERKRFEERLQRLTVELEDRVADRTAAVQRAQQEADRANQAKSEFLSRMSHELRTPLNAILGFAQLIELEAVDNAHREGVQQILQAGRHLLDLINEVLDISKIEAGQFALSLEPVDLSRLADEALNLVLPLAAARNLTISGEGTASARDARVLADAQRLKQVFLNLLGNAVKYNNNGGRIALSWELTPANRVRINISDSGPGIPAEKLPRLFKPFDRLGMEGSAIEGTGLGLALSKRLVELMGGTIGVVSAPGAGSTFWVELSRAEPLVADVSRTPTIAETTQDSRHGTDGCILYIEDNLSNVQLIERVLARRPWVRLLTAMQGQIALDLISNHHPDLILLDLHLPDIPGEEVLRRLKASPQTRHIPVVVVSADAVPSRVKQLLAAGVRHYLTKPIDIKRLLEIVDELQPKGLA